MMMTQKSEKDKKTDGVVSVQDYTKVGLYKVE